MMFLVGGRHLGEFGVEPDMFGVAVVGSDAGVFLAGTHTFGVFGKSRLTASFLHAFRRSGCKYTYLRSAVVGVGGVVVVGVEDKSCCLILKVAVHFPLVVVAVS